MERYLLIIVILFVKINSAYCQIITINESGRKTITAAEINLEIVPFSLKVYPTKERFDGAQLTGTQNRCHLNEKPDVKQGKIVSLPLQGKIYITSDFGKRYHPVLAGRSLHTGIDLRAEYEIVNTIATGIIIREGYDTRAGNYIIIQHGNGIESIYCHLSKFLLKRGDLVFAGDGIAISGATGAVTAPHLHFAIKQNGKFINPLALLRAIARVKATTLH